MSNINVNMANIFEKLADLKHLFKFGEKIVPIIQSLIEFLKETVPLLETINQSISESTKKLPQASDQLSNVTSANEMATTEILDLTDQITNILFDIDSKLGDYMSKYPEKIAVYDKLREHLKDDSVGLELLDKINPDSYIDSQGDSLKSILDKVRNDTYSITLSLQVQDITAQQLASVNHLMTSVHQKLASLILDINSSEIDTRAVQQVDVKISGGVAFDPNATYENKEERQKEIDGMIDIHKINEKASQDEIDKLFGGK